MNNPILQCINLAKGNTSISLKIGPVCANLSAKVIVLTTTILFCKYKGMLSAFFCTSLNFYTVD